jgi:hypothetical protein
MLLSFLKILPSVTVPVPESSFIGNLLLMFLWFRPLPIARTLKLCFLGHVEELPGGKPLAQPSDGFSQC